jgi:hypothetical protein
LLSLHFWIRDQAIEIHEHISKLFQHDFYLQH